MEALYASLQQRKRPEDVAQMVMEALEGRLEPSEVRLLNRAARGSLRRRLWSYTSMLQEFARPVGAQRQIAKAQELFLTAYPVPPADCDSPEAVEAFLRHIGQEVAKAFGRSDFRQDRLNGEQRQAVGLELSRRRYNKLWRHCKRMEQKLGQMVREMKKREFQMIGKHGLAHHLSREDFHQETITACFVAYYTARCNLRSEFTAGKQQRPYDEIADMLFQRCRAGAETHWWAIAQVYPSQEVLSNLTDTQKGELLGRWYRLLEEVGALLQETWDRSEIHRETMIVRQGNDSSTWNNTANAWNRARDAWIELLYAMGMEELLAHLCPGKALRLIAGDVAAWHRMLGQTLDTNTFIWNELPLPWEVLAGQAVCTRPMIEAVCQKHQVDAEKSGWIAPRPRTAVAAFQPTPELVHGVTVTSPALATFLKKAGFFSGKSVKMPSF